MVIFRSKVEEHGQRDRAQSALKNASVFDQRELYLSYDEKQGESGNSFFLRGAAAGGCDAAADLEKHGERV